MRVVAAAGGPRARDRRPDLSHLLSCGDKREGGQSRSRGGQEAAARPREGCPCRGPGVRRVGGLGTRFSAHLKQLPCVLESLRHPLSWTTRDQSESLARKAAHPRPHCDGAQARVALRSPEAL